MNEQDWKTVEDALGKSYAVVKLKIDGYNVSLTMVQNNMFVREIAVYVNGKICGKDCLEDTDIRRRFYNRHKKSSLTAQQKKQLKKETKAFREKVLKQCTYEWYEPFWQSFRSLKRHLIKNNTSIELSEV